MEFFNVKSLENVFTEMKDQFEKFILKTEKVSIFESLGRVLSKDIESQIDVPHFNRSVVDGYAVKIADVQGAMESTPSFLKIGTEIEMGKEVQTNLNFGEAVYVPTGGMVPQGTEGMVMIEHTESFGDDSIAVYKSAAYGDNMMWVGDDIQKGDVVLKKGRRLRPQDIGVIASTGITKINVYGKPEFAIISTGDEIISPGTKLHPGQIIDINSYTLAAMTEKKGGKIKLIQHVGDDEIILYESLKKAVEMCDVVVLSGGSSVGKKDLTLKVLERMGQPGVFTHGMAIKPGKPTILANVKGKPVIGLPGQPASAMIVYMVILEELMNIIHKQNNQIQTYIIGELMENIHAAPGRETYQMVRVEEVENHHVSIYPIYGKSGMITLLSDACGYIKISANSEGVNAGEKVKVYMF